MVLRTVITVGVFYGFYSMVELNSRLARSTLRQA